MPHGPRELDDVTLQFVLTRVVRAAGVTVRPDRIRDAVLSSSRDGSDEGRVESTLDSETPASPAWSSTLLRACTALGLKAALVKAPAASVLETVGPGRPAVTLDGDTRLLVVTNRHGRSVCVESEDGAKWITIAEAARRAAELEQDADWLVVDADLGEAGVAASVGADHHPSPRARLWRWMILERDDLLTAFVYAAFVGVLGLTVPVAVQALVNTVAFGTLLQPLIVLSLMLLVGLGFSAVMRGLQFWVVEVLQRRVLVRVVSDLAHRLPRVRREALDGKDGAELANRFFDVVTIQKAAASLLVDGLEIALTVGVGLVILAFYHPLLLAFDVLLVLALIGVALLGRGGVATSIEESRQKYAIGAWLEELARHDTAFKLGGGLDYAETRADALTHSWLAARARHFRVVLRQVAVVLALQAIGSAGVLGIGGWLVIERQLTLGQLVAAELIVTAVVAAMAKIGKHLENYYDLLAAVDKVGHLLDLPLEGPSGSRLAMGAPRTAATLSVEGVAGSYAAGSPLIAGSSFTLPAGARAALVGADGSGKSLLVEMLAALRPVDAGRIRIDDLDLRDAELTDLRRRLAVVRGAAIVPDTVFENVRMGRAGIDTGAVRDALRAVGLESTVDALPEGLQTMLSASGEPLSRGARSRLAIARAVVARPSLLVLDDALDGIDPSVRGQLLDYLFAPTQPWTLVVVSDDVEIGRRCAHVLRLADGHIDHHLRRDSLVPTAPLPPRSSP